MNQKTGQKKTASYGFVEIREYSIILGDNPAGNHGGPPVEFGWEYQLAEEIHPISIDSGFTETTVSYNSATDCWSENNDNNCSVKLDEQGRISVDEYESLRPSAHRRRTKTLYLKAGQRKARLKEWEVTDKDMQRAIRLKKGLRACRRNTNVSLNPLHKYRRRTDRALRVRKLRRAVRIMSQLDPQKEASHEQLYHRKGWWRAVF